MNIIAQILARVLGYNRKVKITKLIGGMPKDVYDLGKDQKSKFGKRQLNLWEENVKLPYPKSDNVIDGCIRIFSPSKDKYAYITREMDLREWEQITIPVKNDKGEIVEVPVVKERIRSLDSDIVFWMQNQMMEVANEKYKSNKTTAFDKFFPYIIIGVFMFIMMLVLVVGWIQIVRPALEVAKGFTTANIMCNCTNGFIGSTSAVPVPAIIPPV